MSPSSSQLGLEARRILLLRIAGEVDPSAKKAAREFLSFTKFAGRAIDDVEERQRTLTSTAEELIQLRYPEVWKEYTEAIKASGTATDALKKKTEESVIAIMKAAEAAKQANQAAIAAAATKRAQAAATAAQTAAAKTAAAAAKVLANQKTIALRAAAKAQANAARATAQATKIQASQQTAAVKATAKVQASAARTLAAQKTAIAKAATQAAKVQARQQAAIAKTLAAQKTAATKAAATAATQSTKAAAKAQAAAVKKQTSAWMNFVTMLKSGNLTLNNVVKTIKLGTVAVVAFGVGLAAVGVKRVFEDIAGIFSRIGQLGARAFSLVRMGITDLIGISLELNSAFQQTEVVFEGLARSESLAADFLRVLREEALLSGTVFTELADKAKLLVPFSGGDIDKFRELVKLVTRLRAIRPDLGVQTATRALTQFLSGTSNVTLSRLFGIPTSLIKEIKEAGLTGAEAMDELLNRFGIGDSLVQSLANTWKGLTNTIKDFSQRVLLNLTNPAFEKLNSLLGNLVTWIRDNAGQIRAFSISIGNDIGGIADDITAAISGPQGFGEDTIFQAADWGIRLITSLTHGVLNGINTVLIPTLIILGETIASFLRGASPPPRGVLSTIDQWFGPVLRAYLSGFSAADFSALNDIGSIIQSGLKTALAAGDISQEQFVSRMIAARGAIVSMVEELRRFGTVSASVWGRVQEAAGLDIELIEGYLDLLNKVRDAQSQLADAINIVRAAEAAYRVEMEKVKAIQEELRLFDLTTSDIPERYKRGRRRELEFRLLSAQQQARVQQEALNLAREQQKAAQAQLRTAKESLSIYKQMLTQLGQLANEIGKLLDDKDGFPAWPEGLEGVGDAVDTLQGKFKDLRKTWEESFAPIKKDFEFLVNFFKGLVGAPAPVLDPAAPEGLTFLTPVGYEAGARLNEVFKTLSENVGKVGVGILSIVEGLEGITTWYDGQPQWVKDLLGKAALTIAINWATGGLIKDLGLVLAGAGLLLGKAGALGAVGAAVSWSLPVVLFFAALAGVTEILAAIAKDLGLDIPTPGEFIMQIKAIISFGQDQGLTFREAVDKLLTDTADYLYEKFPWFKFLVDLPTKAGNLVEHFQQNIQQNSQQPTGAIGWGDIPDKTDGQAKALTWLQGIWDTLIGKKSETEQAVKGGLVDPLVEGAEDIYDELVGDSIFPDMIEEIDRLFRNLGVLLARQLDRIVLSFRFAGQSMMMWWSFHLTSMRFEVDYLIGRLNVLLRVMSQVLSVLQRLRAAVGQITIKITEGKLPSFQSGGIVPRLETALVHPGELIMNVAQQKNVARALVGAGAGLGGRVSAGALSVNQVFTFNGALTTAEKNEYKGIAYTAVRDVFRNVTIRQRED